VITDNLIFSLSVLSFHFLLSLFLNFPSRSFSHPRHSSIAVSLSSGELAGLKFNQVEVASRKHISAKNRVCKSSAESKSINSSIDFSLNSFRLSENSTFFTFAFCLFTFALKPFAPARRRRCRRCILRANKSVHNRRRKLLVNRDLR
jgi:hypothetical protein